MTLYSPKGFAFKEYFSNSTMNGQGMPTEISFKIPQNADPLIGKNHYMSIRADIQQIDECGNSTRLQPIINAGTRAAPTSLSFPYIASNPMMALFNSGLCMAGSTTITNLQDMQLTNTVYRALYESKN